VYTTHVELLRLPLLLQPLQLAGLMGHSFLQQQPRQQQQQQQHRICPILSGQLLGTCVCSCLCEATALVYY
jgi:hypothetical protein